MRKIRRFRRSGRRRLCDDTEIRFYLLGDGAPIQLVRLARLFHSRSRRECCGRCSRNFGYEIFFKFGAGAYPRALFVEFPLFSRDFLCCVWGLCGIVFIPDI